MTQLQQSFYNHVFDLEVFLDSLLREKSLLQNIERRQEKIDFADIAISHELVSNKIDEIRQRLKEITPISLKRSGESEVYEEEEEEGSSSSQFNLESVIRDKDGKLRRLTKDDIDCDNNPNILYAFKVLYEMSKSKEYDKASDSYKETEHGSARNH